MLGVGSNVGVLGVAELALLRDSVEVGLLALGRASGS